MPSFPIQISQKASISKSSKRNVNVREIYMQFEVMRPVCLRNGPDLRLVCSDLGFVITPTSEMKLQSHVNTILLANGPLLCVS